LKSQHQLVTHSIFPPPICRASFAHVCARAVRITATCRTTGLWCAGWWSWAVSSHAWCRPG
jgi:hypothetical protein